MDETILAAIAAITAVETARAALDSAVAEAADSLPTLVDNGLANDDGTLTAAGTLAVQLLARSSAANGTVRKAANGNAERTKRTDAEIKAWINAVLDADPDRGWASALGQYHAEGWAAGWPRFRPLFEEVEAEREAAEQAVIAEALAAEAKPPRSRKVG